jgi:dimethylglycine oxidase
VSAPRVVVIGAGVVGAAVADELTARGWTEVTVLDRGALPLPGGSSSHAPGLVFQTNPAKVMSDFARTTVEKLSELGVFTPVGGLEVAITPERSTDLRRRHGLAQSWGIPSRLVDADECAALHPLLPRGAVLGGLHTPTDGLAAAPAAVAAQLARAVDRGARVLGSHRVTDVLTARGRVTGVRTDRGDLAADVVVSATGFWGPQTGALVDLTIPLLPMAHQYVRTGPVAALAGATA